MVRVNYDYTVTPTILLHLGAGFIEYRNPETGVPGAVNYDSRKELGLNAGFLTPSGFPRILGLNQAQGGTNLNIGPSHAGLYINDKPTAVASVTYIRNNHTYKAGGEWRSNSNSAAGRRLYRIPVCELPARRGQDRFRRQYLRSGPLSAIAGTTPCSSR